MSICISNAGNSSNSSSSQVSGGTIVGNGKIVEASGQATTSYRGNWNYQGDSGTKISEYDNLFKQIGKLLNIDWKLIAAHAFVESGFKTDAKAGTTSAGGLYQFIASTYQAYAPAGYTNADFRYQPTPASQAYVNLLSHNLNHFKSAADRNNQILFALQGYHDGNGGLSGTTWVNRTRGKYGNTKEANNYIPKIMAQYKKYGGDVQN